MQPTSPDITIIAAHSVSRPVPVRSVHRTHSATCVPPSCRVTLLLDLCLRGMPQRLSYSEHRPVRCYFVQCRSRAVVAASCAVDSCRTRLTTPCVPDPVRPSECVRLLSVSLAVTTSQVPGAIRADRKGEGAQIRGASKRRRRRGRRAERGSDDGERIIRYITSTLCSQTGSWHCPILDVGPARVSLASTR